MRIAVLAASGPTGRQIATQALDRGHDVVAVVRTPSKLAALAAGAPALSVREADVFDLEAIRRALDGADVVLSALGISKGDPGGTLEAGARAVAADPGRRLVWLGALGAGVSRGFGGRPYDIMLRTVLRDELQEKALADGVALAAGATVVHPGPLSGPVRGAGRLLDVTEIQRRVVPPRISRADLASAMLDEAQAPRFAGAVVGVLPVAA